MRTNKDRNKKKESVRRKEYKGPFQINKNYEFETTRKNMRPHADGPTVDEFSHQDTTDSFDVSDSIQTKKHNKRPRKKQYVIKHWICNHASEIIVSIVTIVISSFFGVVVYKYSNHFVAHDKDIEYIKEKGDDLHEKIQSVEIQVDNVKEKIHEIDKKVDIHEVIINKKKD
jgi:hypothetical protein